MLRTALQPRWIALLVLALALATVFATLGSWQLDRSRRDAPARSDEVVDLTAAAQPQTELTGDAVTQPVRARGTFRAGDQLEVVDRPLDGAAGRWVLTPLTVTTDDGTATLPVVRGWVPVGTAAPPPPTGEVEVVGRIQGSEVPSGPGTGLPPGQVSAVSAADLVNVWEPPLYAGYLLATDPVPAPLRPVPVPEVGGDGVNILNLSYALQWWVFAAFAVFLWWRIVRDSYLHSLAGAPGEGPALRGPGSGVDGAREDGPSPAQQGASS